MRQQLGFFWHQMLSQCSTLATSRQHARADRQRLEAIRAEQIRLLYANAPFGFVATVLNAVLLALIQGRVLAPPVILVWLVAMLTLTALRAVLVWRFQRCSPAPPALGWWGALFGIGAALAGIGWGSAGVWLFPVSSITHQVFLTFVLGGMMAGAVGLLSARMHVFVSFAGPTAVPVIVHLLLQGDALSRTMGGMAVLFTIVIIFTAWKLHCTILASLHLRFDNADLVASVMAEKARVDHLNTGAHHRNQGTPARRRRLARWPRRNWKGGCRRARQSSPRRWSSCRRRWWNASS